jgi:hypothetical protein
MSGRELKPIIKYMKEFLEVPHPVFKGFSPCPFSGKERRENKIHFYSIAMRPMGPCGNLIREVRSFDGDPQYSTMLAYDPTERLTVKETYSFAQQITDKTVDIDILAIPIHPKDPFEVKGLKTRAGPYVMMLIQRRAFLADAKDKLLNTKYYDNWDDRDQRIMTAIDNLCQQHDAFFPLIWWTEEVLERVKQGEPFPEAVFSSTCRDLSRNELHSWMHRWGKLYGWEPFMPLRQENFKKLQRAADKGAFLIATAHGGLVEGMAAVICKESKEAPILRTSTGKMQSPAHQPTQDGWLRDWPGGAFVWRHRRGHQQ